MEIGNWTDERMNEWMDKRMNKMSGVPNVKVNEQAAEKKQQQIDKSERRGRENNTKTTTR